MERRTVYIWAVLLGIGGTICDAQRAATAKAAAETNTNARQHDGDSQFVCNTGYRPRDCSKQVAILRARLRHFYSGELKGWTWILVRSEDWKTILLRVGRDPDSPAFSILGKRQTFLEEALFSPTAGRSAELLRKWSMPLDRLRDLAITHELGHAICGYEDEVSADRFGQRLRQGELTYCDSKDSLHLR